MKAIIINNLSELDNAKKEAIETFLCDTAYRAQEIMLDHQSVGNAPRLVFDDDELRQIANFAIKVEKETSLEISTQQMMSGALIIWVQKGVNNCVPRTEIATPHEAITALMYILDFYNIIKY